MIWMNICLLVYDATCQPTSPNIRPVTPELYDTFLLDGLP